MVKLENLSKCFDNKQVLKNINYLFDDKGLYILKGESGCGKTTLLNIISSRISNYEGNVLVGGSVFYLSFNNYLIEEFTVKEIIEFHKNLFDNFSEYKNNFGLNLLMDKKVNKLSMGEKQKVGIYLALSSNCDILLLDEPLAGVDDNSKKLIIKEIKKNSKNKLIILASHQSFSYSNAKVIFLNEGKINDDFKDKTVNNYITVRKLENEFKWAMLLHKKQIFSRIMFLLTIISILLTHIKFNNHIDKLNNEFNSSFSDKGIYYKENNRILNIENFYDHIVSNLAYECDDYFYTVYSKDMENNFVSSYKKIVSKGSIFSNIGRISGLKENEIILQLNSKNYCLLNEYQYCYKNEIIEDLKGKYLSYRTGERELTYKVIDVIFDESEAIYTSNLENLVEEIISTCEEYYLDFYIVVDNKSLDSFYEKISSNRALLNYNFNLIFNEENKAYFLVDDTDRSYFSLEEISNGIACSDIGYSCNSFDFATLSSLVYIDNENVEGKIKYNRYFKDLNYNEIAISSPLAKLLNKNINDTISLRFYFDDTFHILEDAKIIDIIKEDKNTIYHSRYDYLLFKEKFNKFLRIGYMDINEENKYIKTHPLDYQIIQEIKNYLDDIFKIMKLLIYVFSIFSIAILFFIETSKIKKHIQVFKIIKANDADFYKLLGKYLMLYLIPAFFLMGEIILFISYLLIFVFYYMFNKVKIKSRISWI